MKLLYHGNMSNLTYSSVAISGAPGAGRSTLLKNLRPILEPMGFEFFPVVIGRDSFLYKPANIGQMIRLTI